MIIAVILQKVIGWFKFRRNTQALVSMRERFVHHNLIEKFNFTPTRGIYTIILILHPIYLLFISSWLPGSLWIFWVIFQRLLVVISLCQSLLFPYMMEALLNIVISLSYMRLQKWWRSLVPLTQWVVSVWYSHAHDTILL